MTLSEPKLKGDMQIHVRTLRYNENPYGLPENAHRVATFDREILNAAEHVLGFDGVQKDFVSKEGSSSESDHEKWDSNWNNNANNFISFKRNSNPSYKNNGFRLVSIASEQTVSHFAMTPPCRCVEEHAQTCSDSSVSDRRAGNHLEGVNEK